MIFLKLLLLINVDIFIRMCSFSESLCWLLFWQCQTVPAVIWRCPKSGIAFTWFLFIWWVTILLLTTVDQINIIIVTLFYFRSKFVLFWLIDVLLLQQIATHLPTSSTHLPIITQQLLILVLFLTPFPISILLLIQQLLITIHSLITQPLLIIHLLTPLPQLLLIRPIMILTVRLTTTITQVAIIRPLPNTRMHLTLLLPATAAVTIRLQQHHTNHRQVIQLKYPANYVRFRLKAFKVLGLLEREGDLSRDGLYSQEFHSRWSLVQES